MDDNVTEEGRPLEETSCAVKVTDKWIDYLQGSSENQVQDNREITGGKMIVGLLFVGGAILMLFGRYNEYELLAKAESEANLALKAEEKRKAEREEKKADLFALVTLADGGSTAADKALAVRTSIVGEEKNSLLLLFLFSLFLFLFLFLLSI
jgi:hypothetical protein